jgi:PAS domain-containing protein
MPKERLQSLVPEIYEAASNPELWPALLRRLAASVRGSAAALSTHNFGLLEGLIAHSVGYDPDCVRSYVERYARSNVWLREEGHYRPVGTISIGQQLVPDAELVRTEFYNDWLRPQHLHHRLVGVVRREANSIAYLEVMRPQMMEPFGPGEVGTLRRLLPHFEQAMRLSLQLSQLQLERDAAKRTLDLLPTGIFFVNQEGKVLLANRRAEEILEGGDGLTEQCKRRAAGRQIPEVPCPCLGVQAGGQSRWWSRRCAASALSPPRRGPQPPSSSPIPICR